MSCENFYSEQFKLYKEYIINIIDDYFNKNSKFESDISLIHEYVFNLIQLLYYIEAKDLYEKLQGIEGDLDLYIYDESKGKITSEYQKSINEELLELQNLLRNMELEE